MKACDKTCVSGEPNDHYVLFNVGTGHVVCACGWVGISGGWTRFDAVQQFGQHVRAVRAGREAGSKALDAALDSEGGE